MNLVLRSTAAAALVAALSVTAAASAQTSAPAPAPVAARPAPPPVPAAGAVRAEPGPPQVDATFNAWDADRTGTLTLAEFRAGWQRLRSVGMQTIEARLHQQFDHIDVNKNAGIDRDEYANLLLIKQAGSAAPAFSEFDRDGSQKLEFPEYAELVRQLAARAPGKAAPPTPARDK